MNKTRLAEDLFVKLLGDKPLDQEWGLAAKQAFDIADSFEEVQRKRDGGPSIPDSALCFFKDGNMWCCVHGDFQNLQESPAGFGETFDAALESLRQASPPPAERSAE